MLSFTLLVCGVEIFGLPNAAAYVIQMVLVVEYNFLMNYFFTWKDRDVEFWVAWRRFHLSRVATILMNQGLFNALVYVGVHYLAASAICVAITTIVNFVNGDRVVFRGKTAQSAACDDVQIKRLSVVIPVKSNQDTIRETVSALLRQATDSLEVEVILVGDPGDTTWQSLQDYINRGLIQAWELAVDSPGRDSNAKRDFGLKKASGDLLAVVDSDVIVGDDWLDRVIDHIRNGYQAIAGPLAGIGNSFWTRYIDQNPTMAKTPRMRGVTVIDRSNLRRKKPPVTANFVLTRQVYDEIGGPNVGFTNSYEDYEWFSRIVRGDYPIVCDANLRSVRYHREGFKPLLREYMRSGKGCADHIVTHIRCGFAQSRVIQLLAMMAILSVSVVCSVIYPWLTLGTLLGGYLLLAMWTTLKVKKLEAVCYPAITAVFTSMFVIGCLGRFVRRGFSKPIHPTVGEGILVQLSERGAL